MGWASHKRSAGPLPRPPQFRTTAAFRATAEAVSGALAQGVAA